MSISPEEVDVHRDLDAAFKAHEAELAARTHRRDRVHLEARARGFDYRFGQRCHKCLCAAAESRRTWGVMDLILLFLMLSQVSP